MIIEFDLAKSEKNARERGLAFDRAEEFDWGSAYHQLQESQPTGGDEV